MFLPHNRKRFELLKKEKEQKEKEQKEKEQEKEEPLIELIIEQPIIENELSFDDNISVFSNDNEDLVSHQSNFDNLPYMIDENELQLINPNLSRKFIYVPKGEKPPKKKIYKPKIKDV
jgi:hypothetical protein